MCYNKKTQKLPPCNNFLTLVQVLSLSSRFIMCFWQIPPSYHSWVISWLLPFLSLPSPDIRGTGIDRGPAWFSPRHAAGADSPSTQDAVSLQVLLLVCSALLAEDDVAVPRLVVRVPLLPAQRFLPAEALPPLSRCCWPAAGPARGRLAGTCGTAAVREQTTSEWIRWPALHGERLTSLTCCRYFPALLHLSPVADF